MNRRKVLDAVIVFVIAVLLILFVNTYLTLSLGITGMAIAELLLALIAVGAVLIRKESIVDRLSLRLPSIRSFFGAVLLMFGANAWQGAASYIYVAVFGEVSTTDMTFLETYFADVSPFIALISVALIPALSEELLFRGYLFSSFKTRKGTTWAIVITALLFSVIHFDLYKMLPIFILGWAFGYMTAKTGSILLPMIFHFLNNAMSLVAFYNLDTADTETVYMSLSSAAYLWYALAAVGCGLMLVYFGTKVLSGKPRKKAVTVAVIILSVVMFIAGVAGVTLSSISFPYDSAYSQQIREDTVYTETFTLEKDSMGTVTAIAMTDKSVEYNITVTDSDGDVVYDYNDPTTMQNMMFEKGVYTVTYSFDIADGSTVAYDVMAVVRVMTVEGIEFAET